MLPSSCEVDAERARLVLVDLEPHRLGELVPVEVDVARVGVGLEHLADLLGDGADLLRIVAQHAEHHGIADRRAVLQPLHAGAHRLEAVREQRVERGHDALAGLEVLGHDDDLAEVRVGELGHGRQVEARRAGADIGGVEARRRGSCRATARAAALRASVARYEAPCASLRSTISSGRLAVGKNCFCTRLKDAREPTKASAVTAIVVLRQVTHHTTSLAEASCTCGRHTGS